MTEISHIPLKMALETGFENPEKRTMSCQIRFKSEFDEDIGFYFCCDASTSESVCGFLDAPDCTIEMPLTLAKRIERELTTIDYRDPDIIGQIEVTGDLHVANHISKALLLPSDWIKTRFADIEHSYKQQNSLRITDIERITSPTELTLLAKMSAGQPFIIQDPVLAKPHSYWTLDRLSEHFGEEIVRVRSANERESMTQFVNRLKSYERQKNAHFIEGFTKPYTEGANLPELMKPWFVPAIFSREDFIEPQLWLGSVPVNEPASSLHRDPLCGFLYQITGRKKFILYSPEQAELLSPMKAYSNYQPCWVKPEAPNYDLYPKFKKAKPLEVILHPGELLVQPAGWFHAVYALDSPTFSVSYFWRY